VRAADDEEKLLLDAISDQDVRGLQNRGTKLTHENVRARRVELRDDLLEVSRAAEGSVVSGGECDGVQLLDPLVAVL
jgi:hypothetical protein